MGYRPEAHLPQGSLHSILLKKKNSISAPFAFQQTCPGEERVAEYLLISVFSLSWLLLFFSCGLGPAWRRRKQLAWAGFCFAEHAGRGWWMELVNGQWTNGMNSTAASIAAGGDNPQSFIQINFLFSFIKNKVNFNLLCVDGIKKYYNSS